MMRKAARMPGRRYGDLLPPRHPKRTACPTASWTCRRSPITRAYRRRRSQAHRAAEDPRHRDRETAACQERRARRDAPRHGQRYLIGTSMAARPYARDTHHIVTTPGLDAPSRSPRHLPSRADCGKNATRATEGVTRQWQQPNRPSRRFLSRTSTPSRTWRRSYR